MEINYSADLVNHIEDQIKLGCYHLWILCWFPLLISHSYDNVVTIFLCYSWHTPLSTCCKPATHTCGFFSLPVLFWVCLKSCGCSKILLICLCHFSLFMFCPHPYSATFHKLLLWLLQLLASLNFLTLRCLFSLLVSTCLVFSIWQILLSILSAISIYSGNITP